MITEVKPISVLFTLPLQKLPELTRAMKSGPISAEAFATDKRALLDTGSLQVIDNQVDVQTGTVKLKAEFPNDKLQLWPGQFVNVRVKIDTLKQSWLRPQPAYSADPMAHMSIVVGQDGKADVRAVTTGLKDETQAVITAGLIG